MKGNIKAKFLKWVKTIILKWMQIHCEEKKFIDNGLKITSYDSEEEDSSETNN